MGALAAIKGKISLLRNTVLVKNLENGQRISSGGIVVLDDNMTNTGIRPRWAEVYDVGPDVTDIKAGEWILIKHGRWTYGFDIEEDDGSILKVWRVDYPEGVELISDVFPSDLVPTNLI